MEQDVHASDKVAYLSRLFGDAVGRILNTKELSFFDLFSPGEIGSNT